MRTVGLKVLKNKLSEYVRIASQGEPVLISDHDHVVAELLPPSSSRAREVADVLLADLVRKGIVSPAILPPSGRPKVPPRDSTLAEVLNELDADRADK
ncbi:MAG: type II toxin-antitoxin system Phd/YefM family antitoxin [Deltaproteobacteria bacterium]|nr:type II toxin-antitoxin system Phd/YefM family antitoxin [Deltaproteobacteria bacterium]